MVTIGEPKCMEWGEWYDDVIDPCMQHRHCLEWEELPEFSAEDNLGPEAQNKRLLIQ